MGIGTLSNYWARVSTYPYLVSIDAIPRRFMQCVKFIANVTRFLRLRSTILQGSQWPLLQSNPLVGYKFLGPYIGTFLSTREKYEILHNHYDFMSSRFKDHRFCIALQEKIKLWHKSTGEDEYTIFASTSDVSFLEGELTIEFRSGNLGLFRITFTIAPGSMFSLDAEQTIFIGGSQGVSNTSCQMRQAARDNDEICPAAMLVIAVQAFAKILGIGIISGIRSNSQCSVLRHSYPQSRYSTYDALWEASGGQDHGPFFSFPAVPHEKEITRVSRCHRSRARRKRSLKLELFNELCSEWESVLSRFI